MSSAARRILVTGGNGFVGRHLVTALAALDGSQEIIVGRNNDASAQQIPNVSSVSLDVTDMQQVRDLIGSVQPTHVMHLAAIAAVSAAESNIELTWDVNFRGTLNVVLAMIELAPTGRLLFCSSADIYGASFRIGRPINETALLDPVSVYGATKAAADLMVGQMTRQGLRAIRLRPFNHTGPGQSEDFVVPSFAAQIARIERGEQKPVIRVGDLTSRRDFVDVHDVVDAYVRAILRFDDIPPGSPINIASGRAISIGEILELLRSLSAVSIKVEQDPARNRAVDTPIRLGDPRTAADLLGWSARTDISSTLASVLNYYRNVLKQSV
jgi:GDP-4-dehydro-6-deoxy-D-mannose reductase